MKELFKKIAKKFPRRIYRFLSMVYHRSFDRYPRITSLQRFTNVYQRDYYRWFKYATHYLSVNRMEGVYAEFGCHEANTFRMVLNLLGDYRKRGHCNIYRFFAFDSFAGMPEPQGIDKQKIWRKGMNFTSEDEFRKLVKRDLHRITIVKGFYQDSLPKYQWNYDHKIVLAYIDSDYYSSATEVLKFIKDKLAHGAIVAFDDWNCFYSDPMRGERRAFFEWREELQHSVRFEPFFPIADGGMSFIYLQNNLIGKEVL